MEDETKKSLDPPAPQKKDKRKTKKTKTINSPLNTKETEWGHGCSPADFPEIVPISEDNQQRN